MADRLRRHQRVALVLLRAAFHAEPGGSVNGNSLTRAIREAAEAAEAADDVQDITADEWEQIDADGQTVAAIAIADAEREASRG